MMAGRGRGGGRPGEVAAGGQVQRRTGVRADLTVDDQPVGRLESLDGMQRLVAEVTVGGDAERALQRGDGRSPVVQPDDDLTGRTAILLRHRGPRQGADLAVDEQPMGALEALHGCQGVRAEDTIGRYSEDALEAHHVRAAVTAPQDAGIRTARPGFRRRLVLFPGGIRRRAHARRSRRHHQRHAHAAHLTATAIRLATALRARSRCFPQLR